MDTSDRSGVSNNSGVSVPLPDLPKAPACPEGETVSLPGGAAQFTVASKDVTLDPSNQTFIRFFLPSLAAGEASPKKLPVLFYVHGGGFITGSAVEDIIHAFMAALAAVVPALVVSLEYRLAPKHRLPAAYDDAGAALRFLFAGADADPWVTEHADLSRVFLMGSSAGGNIAFHAALNAIEESIDLAGVILHQPFFSGVERTSSELRLVNDKILPLALNDQAWELALPVGSDRDHEFCNFAVAVERRAAAVRRLPPCLVLGYEGDPLVDRQRALAAALELAGVRVETKIGEGGYHGVEAHSPEKAAAVTDYVKEFVTLHS